MRCTCRLLWNSQPLNDNGRSGSTAVAQRGDTLLSWLEGVDECNDNSASGCTNRLNSQLSVHLDPIIASTHVTEGNGATSNVDFGVVDTEDLFGGNTDDGECLVELPQVNVVLLDAGSLECLGHSERRGGREVHRVASSVGVAYTQISIAQ